MVHEWNDEEVLFEVYGTPVRIEGDLEMIEVDGEEYTRLDFEDNKQEDDPWEEAQR